MKKKKKLKGKNGDSEKPLYQRSSSEDVTEGILKFWRSGKLPIFSIFLFFCAFEEKTENMTKHRWAIRNELFCPSQRTSPSLFLTVLPMFDPSIYLFTSFPSYSSILSPLSVLNPSVQPFVRTALRPFSCPSVPLLSLYPPSIISFPKSFYQIESEGWCSKGKSAR